MPGSDRWAEGVVGVRVLVVDAAIGHQRSPAVVWAWRVEEPALASACGVARKNVGQIARAQIATHLDVPQRGCACRAEARFQRP
jgi:hypothetical protein